MSIGIIQSQYKVNFPNRITKNTSTAIDNIFIDKTKKSDYTVEPIINGSSDHDAQELVLHNIKVINQNHNLLLSS